MACDLHFDYCPTARSGCPHRQARLQQRSPVQSHMRHGPLLIRHIGRRNCHGNVCKRHLRKSCASGSTCIPACGATRLAPSRMCLKEPRAFQRTAILNSVVLAVTTRDWETHTELNTMWQRHRAPITRPNEIAPLALPHTTSEACLQGCQFSAFCCQTATKQFKVEHFRHVVHT